MRTFVAAMLVLVGAVAPRSVGAADQVVHLWEKGAPGFEDRKDEPEEAKDYWVKNIHNPSITVFLPPADKATGAAVVVVPGGGHRELVFDAEGREAAEYLNKLGVAAFVLKYRLAREPNSPYDLKVHPRPRSVRSAPSALARRNGASTRSASACWAFRPAAKSSPWSRTSRATAIRTPPTRSTA